MKSVHQKVLPVLIALSLGTALPAVSTAAAKADVGAKETITVQPAKQMTDRQAGIISRSATRTLLDIAEARAALNKKDRSRAEKALGSTRASLEVIKRERPTAKVIDQVGVAKKHLEYEEIATVAEDLVPVYSDLTIIEDVVPVYAAKQQLAKAKQALKKGDRKTAHEALVALGDALIYTEVDLPVTSTENHVEAAQKALSKNDFKLADKELKAAEDGMVYLSMQVISPLAHARDDLYLARLDYAAKRYDDTKKDLVAAKQWLDLSIKDMNRSTPQAAQRFELITDLKQQIDELAVKLGRKEKSLAQSIEGLWHKLDAMVESEVETAINSQAHEQPGIDLRAHMIRAKQHVAFAENLQFYAESDPKDIFKALNDAKVELDAAVKIMPDDTALKQTLQDVDSLRKNPNQRDLYESIRARLRTLIHEKL